MHRKLYVSILTTNFPTVLLQQKALEAAMNDINSSFGKGSVTRLGSAGGALVYACLSRDFYLPYENVSVFCLFVYFTTENILSLIKYAYIAVKLFQVAV